MPVPGSTVNKLKKDIALVVKENQNGKKKKSKKAVSKKMGTKPHGPSPDYVDNQVAKITAKRFRTTSKGIINQVPSDWQNVNTPILTYLKSLVNPFMNVARIPDAYARKTACFRSINVTSVPVNLTNGTNGRFSFCVQPKLGDTAMPIHYQVGMVNTANLTAWDTSVDWTLSTNYVSNVNGRDPRVDINEQFLTAPPSGFYGAGFTGTSLNQLALYGAPSGTITLTPFTTNRGFVANFNIPPSTTSAAGIRIPYGTYGIFVSTVFTSTTAGTASILSGPSANGTTPGVVTIVNSINNITAFSANNQTSISAEFIVVSTPGNDLFYCYGGSTNTLAIVSTNVMITNSSTSNSTPYLGGGAIEEMRPVSMSVLCTYMGTTLNNGGQIAAAYVPSDFIQSNYYANAENQYGQAQNFETIQCLEGNYNGPLKDGCYAWWSPYTNVDLAFVDPNTLNSNPLPGIIVSGVFEPDANTTNLTFVMRLEVSTNYEFITKSTAFENTKCCGSQNDIDTAMTMVAEQPHCMPNGKHLEWLKRFMGKASNFYAKNKNWMAPLGVALASAI